MSEHTTYSKIVDRRKDILYQSIGVNYDEFMTDRLSWDYEKLMDVVGLDLKEIASIQNEVFVGNTPLLELKNITKLARSLSKPGKGARILLKDEANNPTGSFKDRRASLPVYIAQKNSKQGVIASTSGNFGAAVSSQAARRSLKAIIAQEVYDSKMQGQPESLEKARASEAYGAEVQQYTVGPEVFTYVILRLLEDTGFYSASLYSPYSIAGVETLGYEIATQTREQFGREPDAVLITHAGGGNVTGTARGLHKAGYKGDIVAVSVNLGEIDLHDDAQFSRKTFTTGHTGYGIPSLYNPENVDVPLNAARPLRYIDRYVTVTQGEVFYTTEMLAQLEGLQRGPAGNTSLAAAFVLAQEMDEDQIIVVQESEYTGAGKLHTAQLTFAEENDVRVEKGDPKTEIPGQSIIIPQAPSQIHVEDIDLDTIRMRYLDLNVKCKGYEKITNEELDFLAKEIRQDPSATLRRLESLGIQVVE